MKRAVPAQLCSYSQIMVHYKAFISHSVAIITPTKTENLISGLCFLIEVTIKYNLNKCIIVFFDSTYHGQVDVFGAMAF
jgi:capsule polysaccharide modification protein KpsS